ncbi:MAG: FtsQ-type POTRA domain-containing protein [Opitutales bacterium]
MGKPQKKKSRVTTPRGWGDLKQDIGRRPRSLLALRRKLIRVAKGVGLAFSFTSLVALAWFGPKWYSQSSNSIDLTGPTRPIASIEFASDGALDARWFSNWISIKHDVSLMEVDIKELRLELEGIGQIESVEVTRVFPNLLRVTMKEHRPILRLVTRRPGEEVVLHLVGSDGVIFTPENFKPTVLSNLPFLTIDPHRLVETADGFESIDGAANVSQLLDLARRNYPALYRDWLIVSFDRLGPDFKNDPGAHIVIKSGKVKKLRFGADDFPGQMRRLKYLLHESSMQGSKQVEAIDLSLGKSVFVQTN